MSHRSSFALLNAPSALSDPRVALSNLRFAILVVSGGFPGQICSCFLSEAKTEWRAGRPDFPVFLTEFNHFMRDESEAKNRKFGDTPMQFLPENWHAAASLPWTNRRRLRISHQFGVVFVSLTAWRPVLIQAFQAQCGVVKSVAAFPQILMSTRKIRGLTLALTWTNERRSCLATDSPRPGMRKALFRANH